MCKKFDKDIKQLKKENEELKASNQSLSEENKHLKEALIKANQLVEIETERAQDILLSCSSIQKEWEQSIKAARDARRRYTELYKKAAAATNKTE